jgi:hypothetical protein
MRKDGLPGSGTQADPYNGSTAARFDALMKSFQSTPNLGIHLGAGTFQTAAYGVNGDIHPWLVQSGWAIQGSGMDQTIIQMVGSIAGITHELSCFGSNSNYSTDNVVISNLTIDCNWPALATTAVTGLSGEKNAKITAINIYGSNNMIYQVRTIHSYGSWANHQEAFVIRLAAPQMSDATNDVIQSCLAELPYGNHGSPFALHGYTPNRLITNSKVISCVANGINDGLTDGFVTGGVNAAQIKDCQIDSNTFTDCAGAYYQDMGSCDGVQVTNNTVIRGWTGAGFVSPNTPKQNITITGNRFVMQNRCIFGSSLGIFINNAQSANVYIANNSMGYDSAGGAVDAFWTIQAQALVNSSIVNNSFDTNEYGLVTGTNVRLSNNRLLHGGIPWGLANGLY